MDKAKLLKRLDLGSRRAIQCGIRELQRQKIVSEREISEIHYASIRFSGLVPRAHRTAVVRLEDGTAVMMVALGPPKNKPVGRLGVGVMVAIAPPNRVGPWPWIPHWADIQKTEKDVQLERTRGERTTDSSVWVWRSRERKLSDSILNFWNCNLPAKERSLLIKKWGRLY